MAKGDGLFFVLVGLIAVIISIFLDFFIGGGLSVITKDPLVWMVQNISEYIESLQLIPDLFPDNIFWIFLILNPLIFVIGALCVMIGLNTKSSSNFGAVVLLIFPIVVLIFQIIIPAVDGGDFGVLFGYLKAGFYLQLVGSLIIMIGASKNGNYSY